MYYLLIRGVTEIRGRIYDCVLFISFFSCPVSDEVVTSPLILNASEVYMIVCVVFAVELSYRGPSPRLSLEQFSSHQTDQVFQLHLFREGRLGVLRGGKPPLFVTVMLFAPISQPLQAACIFAHPPPPSRFCLWYYSESSMLFPLSLSPFLWLPSSPVSLSLFRSQSNIFFLFPLSFILFFLPLSIFFTSFKQMLRIISLNSFFAYFYFVKSEYVLVYLAV